MRGRLFLGGVRGKTPIDTVLDCLAVFVMDTPGEALGKWRSGLDRTVAQTAARPVAPDPAPATKADIRARWGLEPHQIAETERFIANFGRN
jgi:hypothetical protein